MVKNVMMIVLVGLVLLGPAAAAQAQEPPAPTAPAQDSVAAAVARGLVALAACLGAGLIILGGAKGISSIGSHAVDSVARQPEAATAMFLAWLLPAAMIEGATLFAVVVCLLALLG